MNVIILVPMCNCRQRSVSGYCDFNLKFYISTGLLRVPFLVPWFHFKFSEQVNIETTWGGVGLCMSERGLVGVMLNLDPSALCTSPSQHGGVQL